MASPPFAFTPIKRVAIETIRDERPEVGAALSERLERVLDQLALTSQDGVVTEAAADELLGQLHVEFVSQMLAELEPWGEGEDLREAVVELLTRCLLAESRQEFVRRVVAPKRN